MTMFAIQILVFIATPAVALWAVSRSTVAEALSPVVICYAVGIILANLPGLLLQDDLSQNVGGLAVLLAIPLLLFTVDVKAWLSSARGTIVASLIAFSSVAIVAALAGLYFIELLPDAAILAGSLTGVYTGGTPSMVAVATALQLAPASIVMLNISDTLVSGPYFLLLLAGGYRFYGIFLKPSLGGEEAARELRNPETDEPTSRVAMLKAFALAATVVGVFLFVAEMFTSTGEDGTQTSVLPDLIRIVGVSTAAIALSFVRSIREAPGTFRLGEYTLLIFCVAIGSLADFSKFGQADLLILGFTATVFFSALILQFALYFLFRIDRDTAIMASVATTFSPLFVAPLASRMKNKNALFTGIAIGLMGYAVATYLGLSVAWMVGLAH
jgi:uncharacterized membrane protein